MKGLVLLPCLFSLGENNEELTALSNRLCSTCFTACSISCGVHSLGFALWACPENVNYAPINVGTAHISHGTVYLGGAY